MGNHGIRSVYKGEQKMSQIIAGVYEIKEKIGAGGGGNVYLGEHLRLKKKIVLKVDKRTLSAGEDVLRREVDLLKGLRHTYVPQVYDFVHENGNVCTVMDFIDGESLDKILGRGCLPTQPQVIKWSCQLLEALKYLHNYPPYGILHGDIKPANIMLRPNGDICLIDFNISLALGEEGAVKVGFSRGYASPEHYGADYIKENLSASIGRSVCSKKDSIEDNTEIESDSDKTLVDTDQTICSTEKKSSVVRSTTDGTRTIMLDVRSDIYSLGATLYHLLSGKRPAQNAYDVEALGKEFCSPLVSKIIQKAMNPNPDMRYQSAEEMLNAFRQLHTHDEKTVKHRKRIKGSVITLGAMFLTGGLLTFLGMKQLEQYQTALALAEYSSNALDEGKVSQAVSYALEAIPRSSDSFNAPAIPQVQLAITNALGVYDLEDKFHLADSIELSNAPFDIAISPTGNYLAVVSAYEVGIFELDTQRKVIGLPIQKSALSDVVFLDDRRIIYAGQEGVTAYDVVEQKVLWTGMIGTTTALSGDKTTIAVVNREEEYAVVYKTADGTKTAECHFDGMHMKVAENDIFADPKDYVFSLNDDGSKLAVSLSGGILGIFDVMSSDNNFIIYENPDCQKFSGGFCGNYFAYSAKVNGRCEFGMLDVSTAALVGGYDSKDDILVSTDSKNIYVANANLLVRIDPSDMKESELAYTKNVNISDFSVEGQYVLVATDDKAYSFFDGGARLLSTEKCTEICDFLRLNGKYAVVGNRNEPFLRVLKLEDQSDKQCFKYDAGYQHDEARVSFGGNAVMLFSKSGFRIYDAEGRVLAEETLPNEDSIYDQQFRRSKEKSWLEVTWYDGMQRCYDAESGLLISETEVERPDKELQEEFILEKYRIVSSLHGVPEVYEIRSGKKIATLEEESYLTYVSEFGEYIVTEYVSTEGNRYGILLNEKFEKLAYLPKLCDIFEDQFIFDFQSGNLRQCRLYSLQELIALGETFIQD